MNIIFLHGFLGCPEDWDSVIAALKQDDCYALQLPLKLEFFPDILDQHHVDQCHLVGYSMGGRIALQLKQCYPERIGRLVLVGAHLGLKEKEEKEKRWHLDKDWAEKLQALGVIEFLKLWYAQPLFYDFKIPKEREAIDPHYHAALLENYSLSKQSFFDPPSDTFFLCGEKDLKYQFIYRNKSPWLIPNAGHAAHIENPIAVAAAIRMFLLPEKQSERYPL